MDTRTAALAGLLTAVLAISAGAQEISSEEIVVTSTPLRETSRDIARPATVMGGDELRRETAISIGETLASQPGMSASYFGPAASRPVIRGLGGDRVLMLEDGIGALDVSSISPDHAVSIEPVLADRIEVLKGPATLLFGSGAVGGVVNVLDRRIPSVFTSYRTNSGAVELRGDTALDERSAVGRVDVSSSAMGFHLDAYRRSTGDVSTPAGSLSNSAGRSRGGAAGFSVGDDQRFAGLSFSRHANDYGVPAGEEVRIDMDQRRYDLEAQQTTGVGPFSALRLRGSYNDYRHRELEGPEVGSAFDQEALEVRLTLEHAGDGTGWHGAYGLHYTGIDFNAAGEEAYAPPSSTAGVGLFVFGKRDLGRFALELGARVERQDVSAPAVAGDYDETGYSLSAGGLWRLNPELSLAVNLTRSERHPQALELYADGPHLALAQYVVGNPFLSSETARTIDLTLHRHEHTGLHWSLGVFHYDFADYIFTADSGLEEDGLPLVEYTQADARLQGFEMELGIPVPLGMNGLFEVRFISDYVRGRLRHGRGNLPRIPPLRYGIQLHYERARLHLGAQALFHDRQNEVAANETATDGYTLLSADVSYRFDLPGNAFLFAFLRGTNLLDELAHRHTSPLKAIAPLPGRSVLAGIRLQF